MRPAVVSEQHDSRPRKSSLADSSALTDRPNAPSTTFFLARDSDGTTLGTERQELVQPQSSFVSTLHDTLEEVGHHPKPSTNKYNGGGARSTSRRRSTIKPIIGDRSRRESSTASHENVAASADRCSTPSPLPSQDVSLPSSPKSTSSRLVPKSEDELTSDDTGSQAIASSEDDEEEMPAVIQDSQPELIMPSIKMPSRRPFTIRGKQLGRFKILVAGQRGSGKTSLIKSIVQLCEDIVHVDPLSSNSSSSLLAGTPASQRQPVQPTINEIYASTKPYPSWWSDVDESRILRRRKSVGDSVLERNICFVDFSNTNKIERIVHYVEKQLTDAITCVSQGNNDFAGLLSGRGGTQVDVILYLLAKDTLEEDQEYIRRLSQISNVVPLIAKSDLLSIDQQQDLKQSLDIGSCSLPLLPTSPTNEANGNAAISAPFTVTSTNGPDLDTMDASLLMSPEYVQPLLPSELNILLQHMFELETVAYLRHSAAKKLVTWHATHPKLVPSPSPTIASPQNSTLASPLPSSLINSGVIIPLGSELSLTTSNSYALAKVADHAQREERLAQVRLSKWASDLQLSLQRERERYERLARNERAVWLVERMGEEVREGQIQPADRSNALVRHGEKQPGFSIEGPVYTIHDPLGLLQWQDAMRTRGWIALQVVGGFGVMGGVAFWLAKTWGFTTTFNEWLQNVTNSIFGNE